MTYYIASGSSNKETYHADKECHHLQQTENLKELPPRMQDELAPCTRCVKKEHYGGPGKEWASFTHSLRANPEEFQE